MNHDQTTTDWLNDHAHTQVECHLGRFASVAQAKAHHPNLDARARRELLGSKYRHPQAWQRLAQTGLEGLHADPLDLHLLLQLRHEIHARICSDQSCCYTCRHARKSTQFSQVGCQHPASSRLEELPLHPAFVQQYPAERTPTPEQLELLELPTLAMWAECPNYQTQPRPESLH